MGSDWKTIKLRDAVDINPKVSLKRGGAYPFVEMKDVVEHRRDVRSRAVRAFSGGGSRFKHHDTLMARITPCLENGKIARYVGNSPSEVAQGSTEFIVARGREGVTDNDYVYYLMSSPRVTAYAISQMTGSSGRQRVPVGAIEELEIKLPPLPEQRRIAKILGDLDDKIELNRKMNETLEAMARALFKSWFVYFDPVRAKMEGRQPAGMDGETAALFPDKLVESELGLIPEGWEMGSIYEIADVIYGAPFSSKLFNDSGDGRPLIRIRDLVNEKPGVWTPEVHVKGYLVRGGDIVVGMDGEFRAYLWGGEDSWLNQRVCVFVPKPGYAAAFVRNIIISPLADVEATEIATTVIHLGKNDIDRFEVLIPSPGITEAFNRKCQPLYDKIVTTKGQSRALVGLRDQLLPKLVSGEFSTPGIIQ